MTEGEIVGIVVEVSLVKGFDCNYQKSKNNREGGAKLTSIMQKKISRVFEVMLSVEAKEGEGEEEDEVAEEEEELGLVVVTFEVVEEEEDEVVEVKEVTEVEEVENREEVVEAAS